MTKDFKAELWKKLQDKMNQEISDLNELDQVAGESQTGGDKDTLEIPKGMSDMKFVPRSGGAEWRKL